jgi:hypothetical protein
MQLRGDKNQCQGCTEFFNSTYAFDKHRTGLHGIDRRCLTTTEMQAKGMIKRDNGFWVSEAMQFPRAMQMQNTRENDVVATTLATTHENGLNANTTI